MIRNDTWLKAHAQQIGLPLEQINPASCDVTLGGHIIEYRRAYGGLLDPLARLLQGQLGDPQIGMKLVCREYHLKDGERFTFVPGRSYLCHTRERTTIPADCAAQLLLKSSVGRRGIDHAFSGYGDPCFSGQWTLELTAHRPATFTVGDRIAQLVFITCEPPERGYDLTGHYMNQSGATRARSF